MLIHQGFDPKYETIAHIMASENRKDFELSLSWFFFLAFNNIAKQPIIEHIYLINRTFTNKIGVHAFVFFVMDWVAQYPTLACLMNLPKKAKITFFHLILQNQCTEIKSLFIFSAFKPKISIASWKYAVYFFLIRMKTKILNRKKKSTNKKIQCL